MLLRIRAPKPTGTTLLLPWTWTPRTTAGRCSPRRARGSRSSPPTRTSCPSQAARSAARPAPAAAAAATPRPAPRAPAAAGAAAAPPRPDAAAAMPAAGAARRGARWQPAASCSGSPAACRAVAGHSCMQGQAYCSNEGIDACSMGGVCRHHKKKFQESHRAHHSLPACLPASNGWSVSLGGCNAQPPNYSYYLASWRRGELYACTPCRPGPRAMAAVLATCLGTHTPRLQSTLALALACMPMHPLRPNGGRPASLGAPRHAWANRPAKSFP